MTPTRIRKLLKRRPFRPMEIILDNGSRFVVSHPEAFLVAEDCVAVITPGSLSMEFLSPSAVSHIRLARGRERR